MLMLQSLELLTLLQDAVIVVWFLVINRKFGTNLHISCSGYIAGQVVLLKTSAYIHPDMYMTKPFSLQWVFLTPSDSSTDILVLISSKLKA